jgi:SAM-dependent methyltransferase
MLMKVSDYWNNLEIERKKPYYIVDKKDQRLLNYLQKETNLQKCFSDALTFANFLGGIKGNVLDVGASVCWTSAIISKIPAVKSVLGTDLSEHRLTKNSPVVFEQFLGDVNKFTAIVGDFMDMELKAGVFDVVIFCQSLYMFQNLRQTLKRVNELLVPGGILVVVCERIVPNYPFYNVGFLKRKLKKLIKYNVDLSGSHGYTDNEYCGAIRSNGFDYYYQALNYPLFPETNKLFAGNHFGIKRLMLKKGA